MRMGKLARALILALAVLAVPAAFAALDWYPTVNQLGLLRRQRGDLERKIKEYSVMAGTFQFPDKREDSLLAAADAELVRVLPRVENDSAWVAISLTDLQYRIREDHIPHANFLSNFLWGTELGTAGPGRQDPLANWFWNQYCTGVNFTPGRFLWHGVLSDLESRTRQRLANRHVVIAMAAPLPELLNIINHVSWDETRLEIVRLRLEPAGGSSRAWLVCRGSYLVPTPSPWQVKMENGWGGAGLLIDADSPLLWRQADPLFAPAVEKRELPPASGGKRE